jgi:phospholipid/cholesterol/gamma-HCH transport system ATP-binding protein
MTVAENVAFPKMFTETIRQNQGESICLQRVALTDINYPQRFQEECKRVAIARAIVNKPKYLFCDEPNSGLDPNTATLIDNLIKEITEEYDITTVINTHDMNSVMEIGDNILF